jgi:hypothetical protein
VDPPPGPGFTRPAAHVEIDYSKFVFNLTDKDISTGGDSDQSFHAAADSCDQVFAATANCYESGSLVFPPVIGDPIDDSDIGNQGGDNNQSFFAATNNCDQVSAASASYYCESVSLVSPRSAPISDDPTEDSVFGNQGGD